MNYFLPHVGELNFTQKAFFVGYMVKNLLDVFTKTKKATDRDNFRFKRVETPGLLLYDLFKEYYTLQQRDIFQKIDNLKGLLKESDLRDLFLFNKCSI